MLMPGFLRNDLDLFDNFFDDPFKGFRTADTGSMMQTDIKEHDSGYDLEISLPGYKKEDINAELKDGYLVINASTSQNMDEKDEQTGKYIRRERYSGSCSRSFYVGEDITQEDIRARFENGILELSIPKKQPVQPEVEEKKYIMIE